MISLEPSMETDPFWAGSTVLPAVRTACSSAAFGVTFVVLQRLWFKQGEGALCAWLGGLFIPLGMFLFFLG